jgi:type IV pilus assembly protein PilA
VKAGVAESFSNTGTWPTNLALAGLDNTPSGKYVSSVDVGAGGAITITYGGQSNTNIGGKTLGLNPGTSANNDVIWICGTNTSTNVTAFTSSGGAAVTNVANKYLPKSCRP